MPELHNHTTRDIKPRGICPACDEYLDDIESVPQVGSWALHKNNQLDAREVVKVSEDGRFIWIQIGNLPPTGPLSAKNYIYSKPNTQGEPE